MHRHRWSVHCPTAPCVFPGCTTERHSTGRSAIPWAKCAMSTRVWRYTPSSIALMSWWSQISQHNCALLRCWAHWWSWFWHVLAMVEVCCLQNLQQCGLYWLFSWYLRKLETQGAKSKLGKCFPFGLQTQGSKGTNMNQLMLAIQVCYCHPLLCPLECHWCVYVSGHNIEDIEAAGRAVKPRLAQVTVRMDVTLSSPIQTKRCSAPTYGNVSILDNIE